MESSNRPFIAVIGGLWQLEQGRVAEAEDAAKKIGQELAKAGFGLVVYFSDPSSLEPHVVSGYVSALGTGEGKIRVRYAESQRNQVKFKEEGMRDGLFDPRLYPGQDWEAPFYRSIAEGKEVDAVLLLGGANSTLIAGQIAVARQLPVLAVDEFGGSAGKIWNQLAQLSPEVPSWKNRTAAEHVARLKGQCEDIAKQRRELDSREKRLVSMDSQIRRTAYAVVPFILLLATAFLGMVYTPYVSAYPIVVFAGLVAAGATGALSRAVLGTSHDIDPKVSLFLGAVAGFVVGLAYLIPQWVGAPGPLEPKGTAITAVDKIQFASAVLVAISAGVGFDTVFSRLQKQAQDIAIAPPR